MTSSHTNVNGYVTKAHVDSDDELEQKRSSWKSEKLHHKQDR